MPGPLKRALVREVARRESNLNDVAVAPPRGALRRSVLPQRTPPEGDPRCGRRGRAAHAAGAPPRAQGRSAAPQAERQRPRARHALRRARDPLRKQSKGHHGFHERLEQRPTNGPREGQGPRRDRRRRQLRQLARPGRAVLQGRAGRPVRPRPDAREPRRLPHLRHRVHGRVRRDDGQGRQGPRRRDLGAPERHDQVRRRAEDRHHRQPRHDPRRPRQVHLRGRDEVRRARPTTSSGSSRRPRPTSSSAISRSAPRPRRSGTPSSASRPAVALVNCMPVFIAREEYWQKRFEEQGPADHRRRHQVAGRRDDHAPRAHEPLPRAWRPPRPDDAAERRRQLGLPQHARAHAPRVEEDLEDERRHVDARLRHGRGQRARRPVRLRAVADRPQVGVHPRWRAPPSATCR